MVSASYEANGSPVREDGLFRSIGGLAASCFVGALVTDVAYALSPDFKWVTFSVWLITVGLVIAVVATLVGLIDRLRRHRFRDLSAAWVPLVGYAAVVVVSIFNAFVHSRDAYEAVVPDGLALSVVAVLLLALTPVVARFAANNPQ